MTISEDDEIKNKMINSKITKIEKQQNKKRYLHFRLTTLRLYEVNLNCS